MTHERALDQGSSQALRSEARVASSHQVAANSGESAGQRQIAGGLDREQVSHHRRVVSVVFQKIIRTLSVKLGTTR